MTARPVPGTVLVLGSMLSVQLGTALATPLFPDLGAAGTAWLRLTWAALFLLAVARPRLRGRSRADFLAVAALGTTSAGLTMLFFAAVARIPLGVAATIEFLGPLAVALTVARRRGDLLWSLCAAAGVALMSSAAFTGAPGDWPAGLAFALAAAACWAAYILLTRKVGARWSGFDGLAMSMAVAAIAAAPVGAPQALPALSIPTAAGTAGLALLLPVLPYALELLALRRMPVRTFSIMMSVEPAIGALIGLALLHQLLTAAQYLGIALVIVTNVFVNRRQPETDSPPAAAVSSPSVTAAGSRTAASSLTGS